MAHESALLIAPQKQVDTELWVPYESSPEFRVNPSDVLLPSPEVVAVEKEQFYASGKRNNPDLRPRNFDLGALEAAEQQGLAFKALVQASGADPDLKDAYRWRINEHIGNTRMVQAAATGDTRRFNAYNQFVYGKPSAEIFGGVVDTFCQAAEKGLQSEHKSVSKAAEDVLTTLSKYRGDANVITPSDEVFQRVREAHLREDGFYALLFAGVDLPEGRKIQREEGDVHLRQVIRNMDSRYTIGDASGTTWSLNHATEQVLRPVNYDLAVERFKGLVGHEGGSHLLEHENGMRSRIRLIARGLDRYEQGNEGRAVIREQVAYSTFQDFAKTLRWKTLLRRELATGIAEGLAGEGNTDYSSVYDIMSKVYLLHEITKKPGDLAAATKRTDDLVWNLLESTQKGTDGNGGSYRRYMIYLEGNVACWREAETNPDVVRAGDLGKFDIANPRHIALLQKYGVLPRKNEELL